MSDFTQLLVASAILVPIVVGVVQAIKTAGLDTRFAALVAIALGIGAELLAAGTIVDPPSLGITILLGIGVGLSAAGLWSGSKATFSA